MKNKYCFLLLPSSVRYSEEESEKAYKKLQEREDVRYKSNLLASYYSGIENLVDKHKDRWLKENERQLAGLSQEEQDEYLRNQLFVQYFKQYDKKEYEGTWQKKIWDNAENLSIGERDNAFARLAIEKNLDNRSVDAEQGINPFSFLNPFNWETGPLGGTVMRPTENMENRMGKAMGIKDIRSESQRYLDQEKDQYEGYYNNIINSMSFQEQEDLIDQIDQNSAAISNYYNYYNGTDKLNLSREDKLELAAQFMAREQVGGTHFANKMLSQFYQNEVASNQSPWEKAANGIAQATDSFLGNIGVAVGMVYGLASNIWKDEGSIMENVLDNELTRYFNNVTATNAWTPEEQERLLAMGMSDNAILNSVDQEHSLLSMNTPFELLGQSGYILGSTALSKAISKTISVGARAAFGLTKALGGGQKAARAIIMGKNALYAATPGIVGSVEGAMNAGHTKQHTLKSLEQEVNKKWDSVAQEEISNLSPEKKIAILQMTGYKKEDLPEPQKSISKEGTIVTSYSEDQWKQIDQLLLNDDKCKGQILSKYQEQINQDLQAIEEKANTAMFQDFTVNSVINGIIGTTLQSTMHSAAVQKRLSKLGFGSADNNIAKSITIGKTANGWEATVNKAGFKEMAKRKLRESAGEGIEEYLQEISSAFSQGYAKNSMHQYLDHKYGNTEGGKAIEYDWVDATAAGLVAAGESASSLQAIKAGLYGALSTFGPRINNYRGETAERLEGESKIQRFFRRSYVDFGLPSLIAGAETRIINSERQKIADKVNSFFNDRELQNKLTNAKATASWMAEVAKAIENRDNKEVRDNELGTLVSQVMTLNLLKGTEYYNAVMKSLYLRCDLDAESLKDPESAESQVVNQFLSDPANRQLGLTTEQAVESIEGSVSKLLDIIDEVEQATEEVDKMYGKEFDGDIKESLVFNRIVINDYKKRAKQLDEEINSLASAVLEVSSAPTQLGNAGKSIIAKYGSVEKANKRLEQLRKRRQEAKELIEETNLEVKEETEKDKKDKLRAEVAIYQSIQETIDKEISDLEQGEESYLASAPTELRDGEVQAKRSVVLSAGEILTMDSQDRATMLDPKNKDNYSKEQLVEIEKVRQLGVQKYQDFDSKIKDRGLIERDYKAALEQQTNLLFDQRELYRYAAEAKATSKKRQFKNQHQSLLQEALEEDQYNFTTHLDEIFNRGDQLEIQAVKEMLKGDQSFNNYLANSETSRAIISELNKDNQFDHQAEANTFKHVLNYLYSKGIDPINNTDEAYQAITEVYVDDQGNNRSALEDYLNNLQGDNVGDLQTVGEAVESFKTLMSRYNQLQRDRENNNVEIVINNEDNSNNNPPNSPTDPKPETKEDEEQQHSLVTIAKDKQSEDVASIVESLVEAVDKWKDSDATEQQKNDILDNIEQILNMQLESLDDFIIQLGAKANEIDSLDEDGNSKVAELLRGLVSVANHKKANILNKKQTQQNIFAQIEADRRRKLSSSGSNPDAGILHSSNIIYLLQARPDSATSKFLQEHRVLEFLQSGWLNENKDATVYFITNEELNGNIKADMGDAYNDSFRSVVAVVEHPNGTINIEGKEGKYQVIATMPTSEKYQGINKTNAIRQLIDNVKPGQFITDEDGNVLKSTVSKVKNIHFARGAVYGEFNNAVQIVKDLVALDHPNLQGIALEDLYEKTEMKAIVKEFLSKIRYNKDKKIFQFEVSNLNGDKTYENIYVRTWSQIQGPTMINGIYKTIFELFKEGHQQEALDSHYRIKEAVTSMKQLIAAFNTMQLAFTEKDGKLIPDKDSQMKLENHAQTIKYKLNDHFSLAQGYSYEISYEKDDEKGVTYALNVTNGSETIKLFKFDGINQVTDEQIFHALRNLMVDNDGNPRQINVSGKLWDLIKPQVDYPKDNDPISNVHAGLVKAFKSGTLGFNVSTVSYSPTVVELRSPIDNNGKVVTADQAPPKPTVVNSDNASSAEEENSQEPAGEKLIPKGSPLDKVKQVETRIKQKSKKLEVAKDNENYYEDTETGERKIRVTRLIEGDQEYIEAKAREDAEKQAKYDSTPEESERIEGLFKTPSTFVGNVIDKLFRGIFDKIINRQNLQEKLKDVKLATSEDTTSIEDMMKRIMDLKDKMEKDWGWTFIEGDVKVSGVVEMEDQNGVLQQVPVAGTLDLLAYDAEGNFHIIDFKTNRSMSKSKSIKYRKQLAMYKKLLESEYGVKVTTLHLLPIDVNYTNPKGMRGKTAEYTQTEDGSVLQDGHIFTLSKLQGGTTLSKFYELGVSTESALFVNISWDSLSEEDKGLIKANSQSNEQEMGNTPIKSEEKRGSLKDPNDPLGINSIDIFDDNDDDWFGDIGVDVEDQEDGPQLSETDQAIKEAQEESVGLLRPRADIDFSHQWDNLYALIIDGEALGMETAEDLKKFLQDRGIDSSVWNKLNNDTMEKLIRCSLGSL